MDYRISGEGVCLNDCERVCTRGVCSAATVITKIQELLKMYEGTHNFHNFTSGKYVHTYMHYAIFIWGHSCISAPTSMVNNICAYVLIIIIMYCIASQEV